MEDDKYVVVKKDQWDKFLAHLATNIPGRHDLHMPDPLKDAVVIRRQDVFAGPALHAYAASIHVAVSILMDLGQHDEASSLMKIADYFHEQAVAADDTHGKLPD